MLNILMNSLQEIVHKDVLLSNYQTNFIESHVFGPFFPWFYIGQQTLNKNRDFIPTHVQKNYINTPFMSHTLLLRTEEENMHHAARPLSHFSQYYEFFIEIFHNFMVENKIFYTKIFRANLNLNMHNTELHTEPHLDHSWPHNNFIMYLNTCRRGDTIIWTDNFEKSFRFPCIKFKAITFKGLYHGHYFPLEGERRIVFVVTYI